MGATQQAIEEAKDMGIQNIISYMDSGEGTKEAFANTRSMSQKYTSSIVQEKKKK